jgi:hypothetical protein
VSLSSEPNAPEDDTPAEDGPAEDVVVDDASETAAPVKKAAAKKAAVKKAVAKKAPAKRAAAKKSVSNPVADWLRSWAKDAEPEDLEVLDEPVSAFLATRGDLLPSVRKIVEATADLDVRVAAFKLFVDADAGTALRNPEQALKVASAG